MADIQRGVTPFKTTDEPPALNPASAFKGTVRRYKLLRGDPAYIQYDETLAEYKPPRYFHGSRLLLREMISRQFQLQAVFTEEDFITNKSVQSILVTDDHYHPYYLLGLLNSKLISWFFLAIHSVGRRDDFPKIVLKQTRELPFRSVNFEDASDVARYDQIVNLVGQLLKMNEQLQTAKTSQDKTVIQRQIDATDNLIDKIVFEFFGLSGEEISSIESNA